MCFFLPCGIVVSNLTAQKQRQTQGIAARAKTTAELYAFSRKIAGTGSLENLMWLITYQIAAMLRCDAVVLLPGPDGLQIRAGYPPEDTLDAALSATDPAERLKFATESRAIIASSIKQVSSDPLLQTLDDNPFGVQLAFKDTLSKVLTALAGLSKAMQ